jgi:hypothetical protein
VTNNDSALEWLLCAIVVWFILHFNSTENRGLELRLNQAYGPLHVQVSYSFAFRQFIYTIHVISEVSTFRVGENVFLCWHIY